MHVRITTVTGATDIDRGIAFLRDEVVPQLQVQRGYRGLTVSSDQKTGGLSVLSLWDTRADLDASESAADKVRGEAMAVLGGQSVVERYEQVVAESGSVPPRSGAKLQIRPIKMSPDRVEDNLAAFKSVVLPDIKSTPGFISVRQLIDRATGRGYVGTVWVDDAALQAADARAAERRQEAVDRGVEFGEVLLREVVFSDFG